MIPRYDRHDTESAMKYIQHFTSNAKQMQENVLEEILVRNAKTEYLQRFLNGVSDEQSFKKNVPLTTYKDIHPYIERIANGEPSDILCSPPITKLLLSTGTSGGAQKRLPSNEQELERREVEQILVMHSANKYIGGLEGGKGMLFIFNMAEYETPSGIMYTSSSAFFLRFRYLNSRQINWLHSFTAPDDIIMCLDNKQSMYCQFLWGLVRRDEVLRVGANYASIFVRAIKFLETHWRELCSNIRTGCVSDWITDADCRTSTNSVLSGPNPELADIIENECNQDSWEGILKKLWPRTKYIQTTMTGSMAQYVPVLEFYGGGLPLVSTTYACAEGFFGSNFEPLSKPCEISYTALPFMAYYEFLPVDENCSETCGRDEDRLVSLVDVKVNQCYELVVTTYNGLYRYKMGDILLITSFHNNTPRFRLTHRRGDVLSIDMDKTSEEELFKAVTTAQQKITSLNLVLVDYTSYSDLSSLPGHYVIFWELVSKGSKDIPELERRLMEDCCFVMEESFGGVYKKYRSDDYKSIGPLEIRVVEPGTFDELMDHFVSKGSPANQYKTPRGIRSEEALKLLDSRVVAKFFSQKIPPLHS